MLQEEADQIAAEDRESIKSAIVDLMLKSPPSVQKQLSTAIAIIGKEDFPSKWPNLINDMVRSLLPSSQPTWLHLFS